MLHLKTFGGLSVDRDGTPGTGAAQQRKTLALLALVAAAGDRGVSRDKLIAFLWPETDAEHGRGLLKQACYALRRDLEAPELLLGSIQLRLNTAVVSSDLASFASALEENDPVKAISFYTGPFLDGFYLNGGGEFERWAEMERGRLASQCSLALEAMAAAATKRGEHRVAADWWRRLLQLDRLSSHAALGLMSALDQAGERAEALRCGEVCGDSRSLDLERPQRVLRPRGPGARPHRRRTGRASEGDRRVRVRGRCLAPSRRRTTALCGRGAQWDCSTDERMMRLQRGRHAMRAPVCVALRRLARLAYRPPPRPVE